MGTPRHASPVSADLSAPAAEVPPAPATPAPELPSAPPTPDPHAPSPPTAMRSGELPTTRSRRVSLSGKATPASAIRQTDPVDTLRFMFAVGIECSCPVVEAGRVDQLRDTGHYELWQTDLKLVRELGLRYLRY